MYSAGGNPLPYMRYIEAEIKIPFLAYVSFCIPVLVIPDTEYNPTTPVIVGDFVLVIMPRRMVTYLMHGS